MCVVLVHVFFQTSCRHGSKTRSVESEPTVKRQKFEAVLSLTVRGDADATALEGTF